MTTLGPELLERLDTELAAAAVARGQVTVTGDWTSRTRRTYQAAEQLGSGAGPYVEVVDQLWNGRLCGAHPFTGIAFMHTESGLYWAKAAHLSAELGIRVSVHGTKDDTDGVMFSAGLDDAFLPAVPADRAFDHPSECLLATEVVPLGRVSCVARAGGNAFFVVLFAAYSVKFGRNRLWRLRDPIADRLAPDLRELLTRRRAGSTPGF